MASRISILVVDDDVEICELLGKHLRRQGYQVYTAVSGLKAIESIKENNPQLMLLDKRMPEMDGIQTLKTIREFNREIKVIVVSSDSIGIEELQHKNELNVETYLQKPILVADLDIWIKKIREVVELKMS